MFNFKTSRSAVIGLTLTLTVLFLAKAAPDAAATKLGANPAIPSYEFTTPLFGLAVAPDGSLLVADAGAGVVELRREGHLVAELPGVTDISPIGRGNMFATTGAGPGEDARKLFRVARGGVKEIADLGAFEAAVNPDMGAVDSNPFDVEALSGGQALVADAAGNDLLIVGQNGTVDWIATLPNELVSTANAKQLFGCPNGPPTICMLPSMIPAQPVATSVAIGPDGAYYVGELKGFPAPTGESQIWRIEPGTRHAKCGMSPACSVVATGFTSIVDLAFGPDGTLYVVELDEASWLAVELEAEGFTGLIAGGSINACDLSPFACTQFDIDLLLPIAVAVNRSGTVFAAISALIPGEAEVVELP